jgi:hypothetical protein
MPLMITLACRAPTSRALERRRRRAQGAGLPLAVAARSTVHHSGSPFSWYIACKAVPGLPSGPNQRS